MTPERMRELVAALPERVQPRQIDIFLAWLQPGEDGRQRTLEAVGLDFGISRERVRQVVRRLDLWFGYAARNGLIPGLREGEAEAWRREVEARKRDGRCGPRSDSKPVAWRDEASAVATLLLRAARAESPLTRAEIDRRFGGSVARLFSLTRHSAALNLSTLERAMWAMGHRLIIRLEPIEKEADTMD